MNTISPVILHEQDGVLDGRDDETHGRVQWRTLFSAGLTPTEALTAGVAEIDPGGLLVLHRHAPQRWLHHPALPLRLCRRFLC